MTSTKIMNHLPAGGRISHFLQIAKTSSAAYQIFYSVGTGGFSLVVLGPSIKLTTHSHLMKTLKMSGAIPSLLHMSP